MPRFTVASRRISLFVASAFSGALACTDSFAPTSAVPEAVAATAADTTTPLAAGADNAVQFSASIRLNIGQPGAPAPRALVGSNVQWVDGGDDLVAGWGYGGSASTLAGTGPEAAAGVPMGAGLASLSPTLLQTVDDLAPGALRFPGGTNADVYHWRDGVGPLATRGLGEHVFRRTSQRMLFGTGEFLALAQRTGAEPIITVNVPTGSAAEAAQWVRAVNVTGLAAPDASTNSGGSATGLLPPGTPRRVHFWEIGNEPYLEETLRPDLTLTPSAFAAKASSIIRAMKTVDPSIAVGLPLRLDVLGAAQVVHFPGYAEAVLREISSPVDFLALHNAYLPLVYAGGPGGGRPGDAELFRATMSASRVVESDFANARALWRRFRPAQPVAFAVTEYSAMFTLGGALDQFASSLGAALFVADVLRVFINTPELQLATQWSLTGNGMFGAVTSAGVPRPVYEVLRAYTRTLRGRLLSPDVSTPTFASEAVGIVPAYFDTPLVSAIATLETSADFGFGGPNIPSLALPALGAGPGQGAGTGRVRVLLQNKDVSRDAVIAINIADARGVAPEVIAYRAQTLAPRAGTSSFYVQELALLGDRWRTVGASVSADGLVRIIVPAQSITFIELDLGNKIRKRGLS